MTPEQLHIWLRGFFELSSELPTRDQWAQIRARVLSTGLPFDPKFPPMDQDKIREALKACGAIFPVLEDVVTPPLPSDLD